MDISLVIPVFNEEESLPPLAKSIHEAMTPFAGRYECIYVDDGSTDGSVQVLKGLKASYPETRIVTFRRNFGQTAALSAGFEHARGNIIVTLDADLQNDPADIPLLIAKLNEGYDLVSGWRKERKDPFIRRLPSLVANRLISRVTGVNLHDSGCTLKAYRKEVAQSLRLYGEMHRFIPALASWMGVSLVEMPVRHHPRTLGKSKYGLSRLFRVLLDLITVKFFLSYSGSPIQIFGKVGLFSFFSGSVFFAAAVILKFSQGRTLTGNPLFYLSIFMAMIGVQFVLIGLLGEINIRTYYESQKKKTYVVKEIL